MDTSGVFFTSYSGDRSLIRTRAQWISLALFVLAILLLPLFAPDRWVSVGFAMFITAIAVVGLQLCTGYAGQINLGQSAFMGVGAYACAAAIAYWSFPVPLAMVFGGVAAALFGALFGLSAARIKGFYLALTTIAAQMLFHFLVLNLPARWLGGPGGIHIEGVLLFGINLSNDRNIYYFSFLVLAIMVGGAFGIVRARLGRAFEAVRDDDVAAGMMGINVMLTKTRSFLAAAFYAGIAGSLWAIALRHVSVEQFSLFASIWLIAMMIVGGIGSIVGALVGTFVIQMAREGIATLGPTLSQTFPALGQDIVFASMNVLLGTIVILFLLFEPKGLMHRIDNAKQAFRRWPFKY